MIYGAGSPILGQGLATAADIDAWCRSHNPDAPEGLGAAIAEESTGLGINSDIVAAQCMHETGWWTSYAATKLNNPAGIGITNNLPRDQWPGFESLRKGIHAQVAHLGTYVHGRSNPWWDDDPRARFVADDKLGTVRTIGALGGTWAVPGVGYGEGIANLANKLVTFSQSRQETPKTMRDPQAIWAPSSNFNKGRPGPVIGITDHITQGTSSLAWLRGAAGGSSNRGSSATYLIDRDGTINQLVDELDTPWTDGNLAYNQRRITVEHEGFSGQPLTPPQIEASAGLHRRIAERHRFPLDRAHVIGHYQVPDPNNPALFGGLQHHLGCPGPAFPWDQILGKSPVDTAATVPPLDKLWHPTGAYMRGGFKDWWLSLNPDQMNLRVFGWAKTLEFVAQLPSQPQPFTYQVGERGTVTWRGGNLPPWDIYLVMPDEDAEAREYARAHGLFV